MQRHEAHAVRALHAGLRIGFDVDVEGAADTRVDDRVGREEADDAFTRGSGQPGFVERGAQDDVLLDGTLCRLRQQCRRARQACKHSSQGGSLLEAVKGWSPRVSGAAPTARQW